MNREKNIISEHKHNKSINDMFDNIFWSIKAILLYFQYKWEE
jgi:hypothetical protein